MLWVLQRCDVTYADVVGAGAICGSDSNAAQQLQRHS